MSSANEAGKFFGKYRATVLNNIDPETRGRLTLTIPDVLGVVPSTWAEPCTPLAGPTGPPMGVYMVPPIGAGVWVEFEQGDPNYPIWVGCRWGGQADVPPLAHTGPPGLPNIVIQTAGQNALVISDLPGQTGGIMLKSSSGASTIIINDTGITITGPKVDLTGTQVTINKDALVIT